MLNKRTRQEINELIKFYHKKIAFMEFMEFSVDKEKLQKRANFDLLQIEVTLNSVWERNLDTNARKSVNYYRRKVGLKTENPNTLIKIC